MPPSTQNFLGCLCLNILLKTSVVTVANFDFSCSTLRYLDRKSTATRRYFTPLLFFASLSIKARSADQISFRLFTITLSFGNLWRRERYLAKDGFVSKYIFTFSLISFINCVVFLRFQMAQVLLNRGCQVFSHHL